MGLLDLLLGTNDDKKKKDNDSTFNLFGLDDSQKDEVKKGNYDSWNFEEEELEEDDYFFEDDNEN